MPWPKLVTVVSFGELTHLLGALPELGCSSGKYQRCSSNAKEVGIFPLIWKLTEEHIIPFMTFFRMNSFSDFRMVLFKAHLLPFGS